MTDGRQYDKRKPAALRMGGGLNMKEDSMTRNNEKQQNEHPYLRLVSGGATSDNYQSETPPQRSMSESSASQSAQEDRLRQVILHLIVEEFGQTIDEVLRELNEKFDSAKLEDYSRGALLRHSLTERGLQYMAAVHHMDLDCVGYLQLYSAERLLARHSALSTFRPEAHELLTIGELPPSQRCSAWITRHTAEPCVLNNLRRQVCKREADTVGYFDVNADSVWGLESNLLRRVILGLSLDDHALSVRQAMVELCSTLVPIGSKQRDRVDDLRRALESIGLSFTDATEDYEVTIDGYLNLTWPTRLLNQYPELSSLHPVGWHFMRIA